MTDFFRDLDGEPAFNVHEMVMNSVEKPLLEMVLSHVGNNQSRAAEMLGINRNTLRKKMAVYGIK